jgi:hypothetical protein
VIGALIDFGNGYQANPDVFRIEALYVVCCVLSPC